ncbi:hypothetical protein [Sporomusa aerivorans]|uniref:hypothetical protein n=1 Tax=Sporomusa aerivorans TaxID=204936 RepID=UPI00352B093D
MKKNVTPITPRCGICKKLYSSSDEDGSGLCVKCRPANSQPILAVKRQFKQTIFMEVGKQVMDDFEQEELQEQEQGTANTTTEEEKAEQDNPESQEPSENTVSDDATEAPVMAETNGELKIEDIIEPGRYGVSNSQMIPALKKAIIEQSIEKLALLKKTYFYTFDKSIRYLKKAEREFIEKNSI